MEHVTKLRGLLGKDLQKKNKLNKTRYILDS